MVYRHPLLSIQHPLEDPGRFTFTSGILEASRFMHVYTGVRLEVSHESLVRKLVETSPIKQDFQPAYRDCNPFTTNHC